MSPFWKVFIAIFCYISAIVGIGLAVVNASEQPAATANAIIFGTAGVLFLGAGVVLSRKPRY